MPRKNSIHNLLEVSSRIPWWAGLMLGLALYIFFSQFLPTTLDEKFGAVLAPVFRMAAYVFAGSCLIGVGLGFIQRLKQKAIYDRQSSIETNRALSWSDFEHLIVEAFRREGYDSQITPPGPDGGVDVVLRKNGNTTLVQCKHWKSQNVGVSPIRELAGVVAAHGASGGIFFASGRFTQEAKNFAKKAAIKLIGRQELTEMLQLHSSEPSAETSRCGRCGSELVVRLLLGIGLKYRQSKGCSEASSQTRIKQSRSTGPV